MDPRSKILTLEQTDAWVAAQRASGLRIGFTCGAFDLLHAGHVQYLVQARELCDRLLVAVNTDASVQRYKSPLRPFHPELHRQYLVAGLAPVDAVTALDEDRPLGLIERWKPDLYIKGGDYAESTLRSGEAVRAYGGRVEVIRPEFSTSTSALVDKIVLTSLHAPPEKGESQARGLVLLDRDGTLIRNVPFLHDPARVELLPGIVDGLLQLQNAGYRLAIVTNQQGIGLGYFDTDAFIAVNQRVLQLLGPSGIRIARIYYCPHSMAEECSCRKPRGGMVKRAMQEARVSPECTFVLGDSAADLEAAAEAGCAGFLAGEGRFGAAVAVILGRTH